MMFLTLLSALTSLSASGFHFPLLSHAALCLFIFFNCLGSLFCSSESFLPVTLRSCVWRGQSGDVVNTRTRADVCHGNFSRHNHFSAQWNRFRGALATVVLPLEEHVSLTPDAEMPLGASSITAGSLTEFMNLI